jgi:hypothetical protein
MEFVHKSLVISLLFLGFASCAFAEERKSDGSTEAAESRTTRTGKERLGPKWTDEQRIDNCKVPPEKRGSKPRPSACANDPPS